MGHKVVIEHRYLGPIVAGIERGGLSSRTLQ